MDRKSLEYYKKLLLKERESIKSVVKSLESDNETTSLSSSNNHTGDGGSFIFDKERDISLKKNEIKIIEEINLSLKDIDDGNYGKCKDCNKEIGRERLEFIPYTKHCIDCEKKIDSLRSSLFGVRPIEESVISPNFNYDYGEFYFEDENYVEDVEKISNEEYKRSLMD